MNLNLKIERIKRNKTQYLLSHETGVPQSTISLFEKGFKQPTKEQAKKIADTLQINIKEIFPESWKRWGGKI